MTDEKSATQKRGTYDEMRFIIARAGGGGAVLRLQKTRARTRQNARPVRGLPLQKILQMQIIE